MANFCLFHDNNATSFSLSLCGQHLQLSQNPATQRVGHGAVVWEAAVIFAKFVESRRMQEFATAKLQGKRVLELGAGCALAGIALMMRGAEVTFTDLPQVLDLVTRRNVQAVFSQLQLGCGALGSTVSLLPPQVCAYDWTAPPEDQLLQRYDVLLLTDCIFSIDTCTALVHLLLRHCHPRSVVYCCHEIRDEMVTTAFRALLQEHAFQVRQVSKAKLHPDFVNDRVEVLLIKPPKR